MSESNSPWPQAPSAEPEEDALARLAERVRWVTEENEKLFRQVQEGERRFRTLGKAVWKVQEEERRRLARELHDGLGQNLTALKIQLERLASRAAEEGAALAGPLAEAAHIALLTLNEARRLSHLLRPRVLDDLGLVPALSWLARTLGSMTGFEVGVKPRALDHRRLDPEVETLVFRVVQEALTNAMKHSGARGAEVRLALAAGWLKVVVRDEGRGFDGELILRQPDPGGGGLAGVRDRVQLFGGRLNVVSSPGAGTSVEVAVPLAGGEEVS